MCIKSTYPYPRLMNLFSNYIYETIFLFYSYCICKILTVESCSLLFVQNSPKMCFPVFHYFGLILFSIKSKNFVLLMIMLADVSVLKGLWKMVKYLYWYFLYCDSVAGLLFGQNKLFAELRSFLHKGRIFPFLEHWWR